MKDFSTLSNAPDWSLWLGDCGRYAILLSAGLFLFCVVGWLLAPRRPFLKTYAAAALNLGVACLFVAFVALGVLFANNRFEFSYIFQHGDVSNALQYRIAGIWSGQQGSFLLWACASGLFAVLSVRGTGPFRRWFSVIYGTFLASLAGILAFESPFNLNLLDGQPIAPANGVGLAPSLQNYWVTIHPPTIFLGFGALTVLFAYAFAALIQRDYSGWIARVRPWSLVALSLLGLGLCMGGFWAYETLGWGGFWMWDPVEDVSFVPWCLTVALVHGVLVQTARSKGQTLNLLLGGAPFLTFVYGTFLTRSGFLADASVHSFAEMNRSALQLLVGLLCVSAISFFGLFGVRAFQIAREARSAVAEPERTANEAASSQKRSALSREGLINLGIGTVSGIGLATMIGMSFPFFEAIRHQPSKVIEEGMYHEVLSWFFVPMVALMAIAPFAPWKNASGKDLARRAYSILCIAVGLTGLFMMALVFTPFGKILNRAPIVTLMGKQGLPGTSWLLFLFGLCCFAIVGNVWRIWEVGKRSRLGTSPFLAHIGVVVLMIGLIISRGFEQKEQVMVMKNHPASALGYDIKYRGMTSRDTDRDNHVLFDVYSASSGKLLFTAAPGMYKIPGKDGDDDNVMVWPSIVHRPLYDVYFSLRPPQQEVSDPILMREGDTKVFGGLVVTYNKMVVHGEPGQMGTRFGASLTVRAGETSRTIEPSMQLGANGPVHNAAVLDDNLNVTVASMDAADRSISLQLQLSSPMYPIDVFHKPMTAFVWLGTGLMTAAGLLAAYYRRVPSAVKSTAKAPVSAGDRIRPVAPKTVRSI